MTAAATFDRVVQHFYEAWFRFHPQRAVDVGEYRYAGLLPRFGDDDTGALLALLDKLLSSLDEIELADLDGDRQIDFRVLSGAALIEHAELNELDWRRRDPVRFLPISAIHQLTIRPISNLEPALTAILEAVPAHLRAARAQLMVDPERVPAEWIGLALAEARSGRSFLLGLVNHPRVARQVRQPRLLAARCEDAARAVEDYARFLELELAPLAAGSVAVGRIHFERLLGYRHFLDVNADTLFEFGERIFEQTRAELQEAVQALTGSTDVAAAMERIGADHPEPGQVLGEYRLAMEAAREQVVALQLVSMPPSQRLSVIDTPEFLRPQIPFAAYQDPAPNDATQTGYYYVTPVTDDSALREHNRTAIRHTSVHEAWPGHHLQFVTANGNPTAASFPRLLNASATLYEGWALYCEGLMVDQGWLDSPESRVVVLHDRLWRALRVMVDVDLQCEHAPLALLAQKLEKVLGFGAGQAAGELAWYSRAPTVPMGYATGWALIVAARQMVLEQRTHSGALREFHDALLGHGSVALPLVLETAFGRRCWEQAKGIVFGAF